MLHRSTQSNFATGVSPAESIQQIQEYSPELHSDSSFPKIDKDSSGHEDEQHNHTAEIEHEGIAEEHMPDIVELLPNNNFQELLNELLITGHNQLFDVQFNLRDNKSTAGPTLLRFANARPDSNQALREEYYNLHVSMLATPKGSQFSALS